jgi:hypothetical protein
MEQAVAMTAFWWSSHRFAVWDASKELDIGLSVVMFLRLTS